MMEWITWKTRKFLVFHRMARVLEAKTISTTTSSIHNLFACCCFLSFVLKTGNSTWVWHELNGNGGENSFGFVPRYMNENENRRNVIEIWDRKASWHLSNENRTKWWVTDGKTMPQYSFRFYSLRTYWMQVLSINWIRRWLKWSL